MSSRATSGSARLLPVLLAVASCRTAAPPPPATAAAVPRAGYEVAKMRENLQVTPLEMVFSGVRGQPEAEENVGVRNVGTEPVKVSGLEISGPQASSFRVATAPSLPFTLAPGKTLSLTIGFSIPGDGEPGVHRAMLHVLEGDAREEGPPVDLSGLVARGKQGENEPPLQQVVEALGFATDVGGAELKLGIDVKPIGDEVASARFLRAKPTSVSLYPIARYSPDEPIPYGYYTDAQPKLHPLAVIAAGQEQTLNPELEPDGKTTFDPGAEPFGLYVKSGKHTTFTEDQRNIGQTRHAVRVYVLKSRGGARIPDAYLVAFEEAANGDYQDYVFVIWNVKPVQSVR